MLGEIHSLSDGLFIVEGQHPTSLWDAVDVPSIAVLQRGSRLYLLDTGVGPEQRRAIVDIAGGRGGYEVVRLLNSHAHVDHLGNNDVLAEIPAGAHEHWISQRGQAAFDTWGFFRAQYAEGTRYFTYTTGLNLSGDTVASLLHRLDPGLTVEPSEVDRLGALIGKLGLAPLLSSYLPGLLVDTLARIYPATNPSYDTMQFFEDRPKTDLHAGETTWQGWSFGDDADPDVLVFRTEGHSAGGVVFYLPAHRFLMFADETTAIPIWSDTDPDNTGVTLRNALRMVDAELLDTICAGHFPMHPISGADPIRAELQRMLAGKDAFAGIVDATVARHPKGVSIDELYDELAATAPPENIIRSLIRIQFPVFATFVKLTLLHHCQRHFTEQPADNGFPRFLAVEQ
jgi:glyoxylase-like metal-dependent hydrolase (beta-lactamase superfamily II)